MSGEGGYPIGARLAKMLAEEEKESDADIWNQVRKIAAEVFEQSIFRAATSLPQYILTVTLHSREVLDLGLQQNVPAKDVLQALRSMDGEEEYPWT